MALTQRYGIKYPFSSDNLEEIYLDTNNSLTDKVKSDVLHVLFTPKGQRLRNPDFGTNLIKFIFSPSDEITFEDLKKELYTDISKYVENVIFQDISINKEDNDDNSIIVIVHYGIKKGNKIENTSVGVKL